MIGSFQLHRCAQCGASFARRWRLDRHNLEPCHSPTRSPARAQITRLPSPGPAPRQPLTPPRTALPSPPPTSPALESEPLPAADLGSPRSLATRSASPLPSSLDVVAPLSGQSPLFLSGPSTATTSELDVFEDADDPNDLDYETDDGYSDPATPLVSLEDKPWLVDDPGPSTASGADAPARRRVAPAKVRGTFACPACDFVGHWREVVARHIHVHKPIPWSCDRCARLELVEPLDHEDTCAPPLKPAPRAIVPGEFSCPVCLFGPDNWSRILRHIKTHRTPDQVWVCQRCHLFDTSVPESHADGCPGPALQLRCPKGCDQTFNDGGRLSKHVPTCSGGDASSHCHRCGRSVPTATMPDHLARFCPGPQTDGDTDGGSSGAGPSRPGAKPGPSRPRPTTRSESRNQHPSLASGSQPLDAGCTLASRANPALVLSSQATTSHPPSPPLTPNPFPGPGADFWDALDVLSLSDMHPLRARVVISTLAHAAGLQADKPPARPNTSCPFPVFDASDSPALASPLVADAWSALLRDYPDRQFVDNLVGIIRHGALLGYTGPLRAAGRPPVANHSMDPHVLSAVRSQVRTAVSDGFTRAVQDTDSITFSPIGAVPKRGGGHRLINDLSWSSIPDGPSVNSGIGFPPGTMSYETIEPFFSEVALLSDVTDLVIWKVDLKDAFRHIPVASRDSYLLGFSLDGVHYTDCALNFGGASSPFLFNLFAEGLHWILASLGLACRHYLDDFYGICRRARVRDVIRLIAAVCAFLGLRVSLSKSTFGPRVTVLGFVVDLPSKSAWLPAPKIQRLRANLQHALDARRLTLKEGQSLAGLLSDAVRVCRIGRPFSRSIFDWIGVHSGARWSSKALPRDLLGDLWWWNRTLRTWTGVCLLHVPAGHASIWTDATGAGRLAGHLGSPDDPTDSFAVDAPADMLNESILTLEALAVSVALESWAPSLANHVVSLHVDNQALAYGLLTGRIANRPAQRVLRAIFSLLLRYHLSITVTWIPSQSNVLADALSRQVGPTLHMLATLPATT